MYCHKCGQQILDGSAFCSKCGARVDAASATAAEQAASATAAAPAAAQGAHSSAAAATAHAAPAPAPATEAAQANPTQTASAADGKPGGQWRRRALLVAGVALLCLALGAGIGWLIVPSITARMARDAATEADSAQTGATLADAGRNAVPQAAAIATTASEAAAETAASAALAADDRVYQADVYESLTLRDAPSTDARAICLLPPYTTMCVIEPSDGQMVKVRTLDEGFEGYVNRDYITPEGAAMQRAGKAKPAQEASQAEFAVSSGATVYQADVYESLTLRSAPSQSAKAICLLPPYTRLYVIEKSSSGMALVQTADNNLVGYANSDYLTPEGAVMKRAGKQQPVSVAASAPVYYVDVYDYITLRKAASTSASAITYLPPFTAVSLLERSNGMARVYVLDTGAVGWVNADYLASSVSACVRAGKSSHSGGSSRSSSSGSGGTSVVIGGYYQANVNEFLTLREAASTSAGEIMKIPVGSWVCVLSIANADFCKVRVESTGDEGYVLTKYLY